MPDNKKIQNPVSKIKKSDLSLKNIPGDDSQDKPSLNLKLEEDLKTQIKKLQDAQEKLEHEKTKYKDLFENTPIAYLIVGTLGEIINYNNQASKLLSSKHLHTQNTFIFDYIEPTQKANLRLMLNNAFELDQKQNGAFIMTQAETKPVSVNLYLNPYLEKERKLCRITVTNAEKPNHLLDPYPPETETNYHEIVENISEGIYLAENGLLKSVNTPTCKMFGYEKSEIIDRKVWEFVKPDQKNSIRKLFFDKIKKVDGSPVDIECVRKDGSIFWAEISMRIINDEKKVFGVISDITARKAAEDAIIDSEQRLNMALKGTKAGLWDWNISSGKVIYDKGWAQMLGYEMDDITPHVSFWETLVHPEDLEKSAKVISEHLEGKTEFYRIVHRLKTKEGSWKYILGSGMVIERNAEGDPLRAVGTHQDVSEQKETEQKLRKINITKDKLFSIIAHDLKSPYNAQLGFLELLLEDNNIYTEEQRKRFINTVYHSTKQSFALLDNLLVWSRTQTEKIPFSPEELYLAQVFEEVVELQKYAAQAKNIIIDTEMSHDNLEVRADYEMVNTILRNLLSNAIKFTPEHGRIVLGGKLADNHKTMIYVSDTGVGIPLEKQDKLFDPSSNFSTKGTNKEKGTGIGLILCRDFVERNGGEIWVDSKPGKGSSFKFTLKSLNNIK